MDPTETGVLTTTPPWTRIVDSLAIHDGGTGDFTYAGPVLAVGYDGEPFKPGGASRIPNGVDTDAASDWVRNDFEGGGLTAFPAVTASTSEASNTPGAANALGTAPPG